ncbi:gliding motility-associated ABC transporter substrate-binding protein GldG [Paucihalobacter ruber]|uniref:Gliding motility-associated ABC transporter substrate-binding protein GldG n=1 Tax=Paucihalobacter ruber TaxID=2567861 RepID=A0A506PHK3_9FLAO|nr:gliding motility-associated ABC transporter substrate-binding protein GldG [Paucihalobacter ruber]TPV33313.1 gliding motility-associated ABC transporter substrate-binding protein GldG [Paucihalobacter ruber]
MSNSKFKIPVIVIILVVIANIVSQQFYGRFDLTKDKRYTLSDAAIETVVNVDSPIIIDVFLEGEFPSEFKRLRNETQQLLEEFKVHNPNIIFNFFNPTKDETNKEEIISQLTERGLQPYQINVKESGKTSQTIIFPWALASYEDYSVKIPLIKNRLGDTQQDLVNNSVQHLEYAFADAFKKLTQDKEKRIAVLKGNGQLEDIYIADFLQSVREYYFIAPFTLDSVAQQPQKTLEQLKSFDLVISAKPSESFSEEEKLVLDQHLMSGGKSIWLTEGVIMDRDSLYSESGSAVAVIKDLNLNDFFFKYGIRINPNIVLDMYSSPIPLAVGEGNNMQLMPITWQYSPLAASNPEHPITTNLNLVKFDFASQIDTLKNNLNKTVLLQSSPLSKLQGVPAMISLDIVTAEPDKTSFNKGPQNLAVLIEGEFTSVYNNRVLPFELTNFKSTGNNSKMLVISDGDVIKNDVLRKQPQDLGFDRSGNQPVGNKEFLLNAVNYMLQDDGLVKLRSKEVAIAFLDPEKIAPEKTKWQVIAVALPLLILAVFSLVFGYLRKQQYT